MATPQFNHPLAGKIFLVVSALATVFTLGLLVSCKSKPGLKAAVECSKHQAGIQCTVNQTKGKAKGNVCWDVTLTCKNGTEVKGGGCRAVDPGTPGKHLIPADELPNLAKCDKVVKSKIANVRVLQDVSE